MSTLAQRIAREDLGPAREPRTGPRPDARHRVISARIAERLFGESMLGTWFVTAMLVLLGLLLVRPMIMSTLSWHRTASLLQDRRAEVGALRTRHHALERQLAYYGTDAFLAERAREYGLVRPGETPFVIREYAHDASGARFSLDRATAHIGSIPKSSRPTKAEEAAAAAASAPTAEAPATTGTAAVTSTSTTTATTTD
jgi:cell division protein FtsB